MSTHRGRSWLVARDPTASPDSPSRGVAWSPKGRYLAVGQDPDGLVVYDVARRRRLFRIPFLISGGASFSPDSSHLVYQSNDIREDNLGVTSVSKIKLRLVARNADSPVWGRGGLAFTRRGEKPGIALKTRRSSRLIVPFGFPSELFPVDWSRDGRRLLAVRSPRALLVTPATRQVRTLSPIFSTIDALSRDGNTILGVINGDVVAVTADGAVTVLAHGAVNPTWTR